MLRYNERQRGTVLVEFAIVLPIFILLLIGTIEFGIVLNDFLVLQNAAREGARYGAIGSSEAAIKDRVRDYSFHLNNKSLAVQVTNAMGTKGSAVTVKTTYPVPLITPLMKSIIHSDSFNLQAEALMRLE